MIVILTILLLIIIIILLIINCFNNKSKFKNSSTVICDAESNPDPSCRTPYGP